MHDPMAVAHEVPFPVPRRVKWREARHDGRRWGWTRRRRTSPENLGEPVYPWWRLDGWTFALGGRVYGWRRLATIWHVEPKGRDSGDVCKHYRSADDTPPWKVRLFPWLRLIPANPDPGVNHKAFISDRAWKWHVWHWRIQLPWLQEIRARLFDRCALCGRKGRPNLSHQWEGKRLGWWKFRSREGLYHMECSALVHLRRTKAQDEVILRQAVAALALLWDIDAADVPERLFSTQHFVGAPDGRTWTDQFNLGYRLKKVLEGRR